MTPVRLEPAALRSRVKHSTTEPLRSLTNSDVTLKTIHINWLKIGWFGFADEPLFILKEIMLMLCASAGALLCLDGIIASEYVAKNFLVSQRHVISMCGSCVLSCI